MKKLFKKSMSLLLTFAMIATLCPSTAWAKSTDDDIAIQTVDEVNAVMDEKMDDVVKDDIVNEEEPVSVGYEFSDIESVSFEKSYWLIEGYTAVIYDIIPDPDKADPVYPDDYRPVYDVYRNTFDDGDQMTITYKDGNQVVYTYGDYDDMGLYGVFFDDDMNVLPYTPVVTFDYAQQESPWDFSNNNNYGYFYLEDDYCNQSEWYKVRVDLERNYFSAITYKPVNVNADGQKIIRYGVGNGYFDQNNNYIYDVGPDDGDILITYSNDDSKTENTYVYDRNESRFVCEEIGRTIDNYEVSWMFSREDATPGTALDCTVRYWGINCQVPLYFEESNIKSIEFEPAEPIEVREEDWYPTYNGYRTYYWRNKLGDAVLKVNYKDDTSETLTFDENGDLHNSDGDYIDVNFDDDQINNPFTVGKNTGYITYMGVTVPVEITMVASPIESLEYIYRQPIKILKETNGYRDYNGDFVYNTPNVGQDGDIVKVTYRDDRGEVTYIYSLFTNSYVNQNDEDDYLSDTYLELLDPYCEGGKSTLAFRYMGLIAEIPVEIVDNPVQSISYQPINPRTVAYETNGYTQDDDDGNSWYVYWFDEEDGDQLTLNLNDGSEVVYTYKYIEIEEHKYTYAWVDAEGNVLPSYYQYDSDQAANIRNKHWEIGENNAEISCAGLKAYVPVTVQDVPIDHVTFEAAKGVIECNRDEDYYYDAEDLLFDSSVLDREGNQVTIYMKDGTKEVYTCKLLPGAVFASYYTADGKELSGYLEIESNMPNPGYDQLYIGREVYIDISYYDTEYNKEFRAVSDYPGVITGIVEATYKSKKPLVVYAGLNVEYYYDEEWVSYEWYDVDPREGDEVFFELDGKTYRLTYKEIAVDENEYEMLWVDEKDNIVPYSVVCDTKMNDDGELVAKCYIRYKYGNNTVAVGDIAFEFVDTGITDVSMDTSLVEVMENTCGSKEYVRDEDDNDTEDTYYNYYLDEILYGKRVTVTYDNGEKKSYVINGRYIVGDDGERLRAVVYPYSRPDGQYQDQNPWSVGNTYETYIAVAGQLFTIPIAIVNEKSDARDVKSVVVKSDNASVDITDLKMVSVQKDSDGTDYCYVKQSVLLEQLPLEITYSDDTVSTYIYDNDAYAYVNVDDVEDVLSIGRDITITVQEQNYFHPYSGDELPVWFEFNNSKEYMGFVKITGDCDPDHQPTVIGNSATELTCTTDKAHDEICMICGMKQHVVEEKTTGHDYDSVVTKATLSKNGSIVKTCKRCDEVATSTIAYPKTIKLSTTSYTYDGKVKKPSVSVVDSNGKTISSSNYTVTYPSGRKNVGKYTVKVAFKGNYSGTKSLTFTINPPKTSIKSLSAGKKAFTLKWTKKSTQVTGYQIQYSTSSKFASGNKTVTVSSYKTVSKTVSKLTAKKKYYVRIRTYKTVSGTKYYSGWTTAKAVTTKK